MGTMFATFFVSLLPEPSSRQLETQDVFGQHPAVNLPETEPHLTKQPSEALSTRTAKAPAQRSLSDFTTDHGTVVSIYI